jgi:hypothetical protein
LLADWRRSNELEIGHASPIDGFFALLGASSWVFQHRKKSWVQLALAHGEPSLRSRKPGEPIHKSVKSQQLTPNEFKRQLPATLSFCILLGCDVP